jgi:hypothetical protein
MEEMRNAYKILVEKKKKLMGETKLTGIVALEYVKLWRMY